MKPILPVAAVLIFAGAAFCQLPQCGAIGGWQQQGQARAYDSSNLFEYMNGNSEGYFIYNFATMKGVTCQSGESTIVIDISEFSDPEYAYGMFTSTRDPRLPVEKLGISGQVTPRKVIFVKDKYYVELGANPEKDFTKELRAYAATIEKSISGRTTIPEIIGWFPKEDLAGENSVRLIPESVLGLRLLKSGYVGQYRFGKGFIVREASPRSCRAVDEQAEAALRRNQAGDDCGRSLHRNRQVSERNVRVPERQLCRWFRGFEGRPGRRCGINQARRKHPIDSDSENQSNTQSKPREKTHGEHRKKLFSVFSVLFSSMAEKGPKLNRKFTP